MLMLLPRCNCTPLLNLPRTSSLTYKLITHTSRLRKLPSLLPSLLIVEKLISTKSPVDMRITLTEQEENVCTLLDSLTNELNQGKSEEDKTVLRIAGGWVRDKLLGLECNDIDIAINNKMGHDFATIVSKYLVRGTDKAERSVGVVAANPEKSKHLETATLSVLDVDCDFVNLRNETYATDSRIPTAVTFGTPSDDSYRRDITINALFYNIHTRKVEDYTNQGLSDLKNCIVRTPLPSYKTFEDDPLRILRCLRFSTRFGFKMTDDIIQAINDIKIRQALSEKISKERIFTEIDKMMKGPDPVAAIDYLCQLQLYPAVFAPRSDVPIPSLATDAAQLDETQLKAASTSARMVQWFQRHLAPEFAQYRIVSEDDLRLMYLSCVFAPFKVAHDCSGAASEPFDASKVMLATTKSSSYEQRVIKHTLELTAKLDEFATSAGNLSRVELGNNIRAVGAVPNIEERWPVMVFYALIWRLMPYSREILQRTDDEPMPPETVKIISAYTSLFKRIDEHKLMDCWNWRPILNGGVVMQVLGIRPCSQVKDILSAVMDWQLKHPQGSVDDCKNWLIPEFAPLVAEIAQQGASKNQKQKKKQKSQS